MSECIIEDKTMRIKADGKCAACERLGSDCEGCGVWTKFFYWRAREEKVGFDEKHAEGVCLQKVGEGWWYPIAD